MLTVDQQWNNNIYKNEPLVLCILHLNWSLTLINRAQKQKDKYMNL